MKLSPDQLEIAIKGCISGDRRCQELVFKAFFGKMMGVCLRYTRDRDTAQDIIQESFIKAFDKLSDFNFSGSFEGWLRRIVVNSAIDHFRKSKNTISLEEEGNVKEEDDDNAPDLMEEEKDDNIYENIRPEMVYEAMQQLTPAYRTVFNLYVYENYSHKEIAEMLNINIGTSKSNLAKAKMRLKVLLQKHLTYK
jgi:RNA polymerase sigma-70 factor, ECF subfamily